MTRQSQRFGLRRLADWPHTAPGITGFRSVICGRTAGGLHDQYPDINVDVELSEAVDLVEKDIELVI